MATEDCFQHGVGNLERDDGGSPSKKVDLSAATTSDNLTGSFDCNICLDNAHDPVVSLCGHLYCWPCIYQWIYFQGASITPEEQQQCPVCKAGISQTTLVPLYGRGQSSHDESKDQDIPSRPRACGVGAVITTTTSTSPSSHNTHRNPYRPLSQSPRHQHNQNRLEPPTPVLPTPLHPMIGMFGEMFYTRVFGNSPATSLYWYPNSYHHMGNTSPRARRQEMQAEKSLNRISGFLLCCFVLCLLLF